MNITTRIIPSHRCVSINELFNRSILEFQSLGRIKYYYLPCQEMCFYDDLYICLCNSERHANCFEFNHNIELIIVKVLFIVQIMHPVCPSTIICSCPECFYGTQCEVSTHTFVLSLDVILGYHIHPDISFTRQSSAVKVSATLTMILTIIGMINNILSIITFKVNYINFEILVTCYFSNEFYFQLNNFINKLYYYGISIKRFFFSISDWLSSCVSIERVFSAIKGLKFDKNKSKRYAKYLIIITYIYNRS